jgi:putative copper export protein
VAVAPHKLVVVFSEPMLATGLHVDLASSVRVDGAPSVALDAADSRRAIVTLPRLSDGTFVVRVSARDAADLHETVARSSFAVGADAPAASAPEVAGPDLIETLARWLNAVGIAIIVGVSAVRLRRRRSGATSFDVSTRRLHLTLVAAVVAATAGRCGVLVARMASIGGPPAGALRTVLASPDTRRLLPFALGVLSLMLAERRRIGLLDARVRPRGVVTCRDVLAWAGAVELAVVIGWGDHGALSGSPNPVLVAAKSAHLVGIGLWVGVLAVALIIGAGTGATRTVLSAMSGTAIAGAVITVCSGLVLASGLVVSLTALLTTAYGLMLATKVSIMLIATLIGAAAHRMRRPGWSRVELALLGSVLLLGAGMATAAPAIDPSFLPARVDRGSPLAVADADDLVIQIAAIPGRPGVNSLEVRVADTRRPSPGTPTSVDLDISGQIRTASIDRTGRAFIEGVDLPNGSSPAVAVIHRDQWPDARASVDMIVAPPRYVHPVVGSSAPLRTPLLLVSGLIAVVASVGRKRRTSTQPVRSAFDDGDRDEGDIRVDLAPEGDGEAASGRLLVAVVHVPTGVTQCLDRLVE